MSRTRRTLPSRYPLRRPAHLNIFRGEERCVEEMTDAGFTPTNRQRTIRTRQPTNWDDITISGYGENYNGESK